MSESYNFDDMIEALTEEAESLEGIRGSTNAPALRDAIDWMKQTRAALAQAERERDEAQLDIRWLINNDIHNKAQPADQLAMIRERLLTIRSRRYKP